MGTQTVSGETVERIVQELLARSGKSSPLTNSSNLHTAGLTSEDGVELACDLQARLGINVPDDVNPLIHENGKRMRNLGELKAWVEAQYRMSVKAE